ncbi:cell wall-active antibiotics response protein LiaF [Paenibacillus sepulcri]|uniref:Cell wall-active antibiotics response LiaF-like C-terminal domain-containing protein n=1 Tax=Paenibacillus sepulcri TaxID=359917 RepID=A0ABS7C7S4_9BACL|nr:hypothetical protein [Paenibacillus sepulcri]
MLKRLLIHPFIGYIAVCAGIYWIIAGTGYGYYDPLIWFSLGSLLSTFRSRIRWAAIIPWTITLILLSQGLDLDLPGVLAGAALIYAGYILLLNKRSFLQNKPEAGNRNRGAASRVPLRERFGDVYIRPVALTDLSVPRGIGDVHIDLSQAIAAEGEQVITVDRLLGNVTVYLPYDLAVHVDITVYYGSLDVLGRNREGLNPRFRMETANYPQAGRKINLVMSSIIGDMAVRYL